MTDFFWKSTAVIFSVREVWLRTGRSRSELFVISAPAQSHFIDRPEKSHELLFVWGLWLASERDRRRADGCETGAGCADVCSAAHAGRRPRFGSRLVPVPCYLALGLSGAVFVFCSARSRIRVIMCCQPLGMPSRWSGTISPIARCRNVRCVPFPAALSR